MSDNLRKFVIGLDEYVDKEVPEFVRELRDGVALEGLAGLVFLTDVDTGRARGNYQTTVGTPADGFIEDQFDPGGAETISAGEVVIAGAADPFDPIWIHNGVPYITYLNDGTAKITARRMLEQTVERINRILSE